MLTTAELTWPRAKPSDAITIENSLIWARLMLVTRLTRCPMPSALSIGKITARLRTTKKPAARATRTMPRSGMGICIPSATKKRVMKKSRRLVTLATTSML